MHTYTTWDGKRGKERDGEERDLEEDIQREEEKEWEERDPIQARPSSMEIATAAAGRDIPYPGARTLGRDSREIAKAAESRVIDRWSARREKAKEH